LRFAITGSTGLIGSAVTRDIRARGHEVTRIVRSYSDIPHGERAVIWHPAEGVIEQHGLENHDVFVHFAGESIAGIWTNGKKRRIRDSRLRGTTLLANTIAQLEHKPRAFFSASAMGFYGADRGNEILDERSTSGTGFLADVAREWEGATRPAQDAGIRVVTMRFGNVMSRDGGLLGALLPVFKLGLGAPLGDGRQYWSWIAIDDIAPAILHLLEHTDISGPVNFTAPEPVTNEEFSRTLAAVVHRATIFKLPRFAAKLAPGGMGDEMLLASQRMIPTRLLESGYSFRHPKLRDALAALVK
jgi:uncharacterized protein (TIGR01777 family)